MKNLRAVVHALAVLLFVSIGICSATPGTEGASFLNIPVGGRPAALGGAYSALARDAYAPIWNSAGLSFLPSTQLAASHLSYARSVSYEFASLVHPLNDASGVGVAVQYFNPSKIDETDLNGNKTGTFSGSFGAYSLSCGHKVGPRFAFGGTGRFVQGNLDGSSASAGGADLGGLYLPSKNLSIGAVVANLGSSLKFVDKEDSLPLEFRLGSAYKLLKEWTVSVEGGLGRSERASAHVGVEWDPISILPIRLGYQSGPSRDLSGLTGLSAGMGVKLKDQQFDYTLTSLGDLGVTQYFSFVFAWAGKSP